MASIVIFARTRDFDLLLNIQLLAIAHGADTVDDPDRRPACRPAASACGASWRRSGHWCSAGSALGIRWFVLWLVLFLGSGLAAVLIGSQSPMPEWFSSLMLALNIAVGGAIVFTLLALFAKQRQDALVGLRIAQERAENLLLTILPGSIAERLKESPQTIADQFAATSVLFADVVDFTPRSNGLTAAEVVGLLDRLFGEFDELAERYGLEKIKTIGDAYMVASGVPDPRPDHARVLALLALDMVAATRSDGAVGDLDSVLRIGINSGPGGRWGHRPQAVPLRPVGRRREHRQPNGVAGHARPNPDHPRHLRADQGRVRMRVPRHRAGQGQGRHGDLVPSRTFYPLILSRLGAAARWLTEDARFAATRAVGWRCTLGLTETAIDMTLEKEYHCP